MQIVEDHYREHSQKYLKRLTYRAGTEWDAEDVLHEAYARAIRSIHAFDGSNFDRWFATILNNALRDHKNGESGITKLELREDDLESVECTLYPTKALDEIDKLIAARSPEHQEVLRLHIHHYLSPLHISQITDIKYKTAHQAISRFRTELQEKYGN